MKKRRIKKTDFVFLQQNNAAAPTEEKKYDLGIVGDLKSKLIGVVIGLACFATIAQTALNNLNSWFGINYQKAYYLFVFLYFILPVLIVIILFLRKGEKYSKLLSDMVCIPQFQFHLSSGRLKKKIVISTLQRFKEPMLKKLLIISIITFSGFGIFLFLFGSVSQFFLWTYGIVGVLLSVFVILCMLTRKIFFSTQYYGILLMLLLAALLILYKNIKTLAKEKEESTASIKSVFILFDNKNKFSENIVDRVETLSARVYAYNKKINLQLYSSQCTIKTDSTQRIELKCDPIIQNAVNKWHTVFKAGWTNGMFKKNETFFTILNTVFTSIDTAIQEKHVSLSDKIMHGGIKSQLDLFPELQQLVAYNYLCIEMSKLAKIYNDELGVASNKAWLSKIRFLQYKGLTWFFVFLVLFLTLFYCARHIVIMKEDEVNSRDFATDKTSILLTEIESISKDAYGLKNAIYLIVLLLIPYFKTFTEKNVDPERPFINLNISDITGGMIEVPPPGSNYNIGGTINRGDSISFNPYFTSMIFYTVNGSDTSVVNIFQGNKLNNNVLMAIKKLGENIIENGDEKKIFSYDIDSLKQ